jgi:hypothetical protein
MITPKASDLRLRSRPAAMAAATEPPSPRISTAANWALPAKTSSEKADACQTARPASAAAIPKAIPNGVTARAIEAA